MYIFRRCHKLLSQFFKLCSRHCLQELSDVTDGVDDRHEVPRPEKLEQPEHVEEEVGVDDDEGGGEDEAVVRMSLPPKPKKK